MLRGKTDARRKLTEMIGGLRFGMCLRVLVRHRIPDLLFDRSCSAQELAQAAGLDASLLERVLRVMADIGFLKRNTAGAFSNTELSNLLRSDSEGSLRNYALLRTDDAVLEAWMGLPAALEGGRNAFEAANGVTLAQYTQEHPELKEIGNRSMAEVYQQAGQRIARGFDFGRFDSMLDVGGGLGHVMAEILVAHPRLRGGLYDLPAVTDSARKALEQKGLGERCDVIAGDFFGSVPGGYEAYFLKSVIHDWNDNAAVRVLENCRNVIPADGRLLITEQILETGVSLYPDRYIDLEMFVLLDGKERTASEFTTLLASSGFALVECHAIADSPFSVIEATPA